MAKLVQPNSNKCLLWLLRGNEGYGVASIVISFSAELKKRDWTVLLVCETRGGLVDTLVSKGIDVVCLEREPPVDRVTGSFFQKFKILIRTLGSSKKLVNAVIDQLGDIQVAVVQCSIVFNIVPVARLAKHYQCSAVWRMSNSVRKIRPFNYSCWYLQLLCSVMKVEAMGNSQYTTDSLGDGPTRKYTNLHGVDSSRFDADAVKPRSRSEMGIGHDDIVFGIIARLDDSLHKGQVHFYNALRHLVSRDKKIHLVLFGGPVDGEVAKIINSDVVESNTCNVRFMGSKSDIECWIGMLDVVVSVRVDAEPFGLTIVEAMMMGKPVLAHSLGGPSEIVVDGVTGWLINSMDEESVRQSVEKCLSTWEYWEKYGNAGRERALKCFTIDKEVDRWLELVQI